jgi:Phosphorylase superfamily
VTQAKYDFAVVVALGEEAGYFREFVACGDPFQVSGYTAWPIVEESWDAYGKGVLVMSGDMGIDRARTSTAAVVAELKVRLIANIGIAGRIADWLSIGDIVVPREVLDFCTGGKIAGDPTHTLYKHRPKSKAVTSSLVGLAETHLQKDSRLMASINLALKRRFSNPALWPMQRRFGRDVFYCPIGGNCSHGSRKD